MKSIRISGLVKLMNHSRTQLTHGIPASQIKSFKKMILDATAFVEETCQQHHVSLDNLPGPTRRAYAYLKSIDLENLPVRGEQDETPPPNLRISKIVASCRSIQGDFAELGKAQALGRLKQGDLETRLTDLHRYITNLAAMLDEVFQKAGAGPDGLAEPTRRAYQWLKLLCEQGNFEAHIQTLTKAYHALPDGHIELYNFAGLYRSRLRKGVWHLVLNEGFVGAPQSVIKALVAAAVSRDGGAQKARVRQYSDSEEFREILLAMEVMGVQYKGKTRGATYDLEEVFQRVNNRYFRGRMAKPILTWNRIITRAKYGHYIPATDTVMISIALDTKEVPAYVIDHVMHHELLHKNLGTKVVNSRRLAHTPEFRAEERKFKHYQQAKAFLSKMSRGD